MEEKNRSWDEVLEALDTTHTLSVREICKRMKASRTWVNKYVLPHIDMIYLNSNIRSDTKSAGKINWVMVASMQLGREYMRDSVWCNEKEFDALILSSILSITKQTKSIPIEQLVTNPRTYAKVYRELGEKVLQAREAVKSNKTVENALAVSRLLSEQDLCHMQMLTPLGKYLFRTQMVKTTERSAVSSIPCNVTLPPLEKWKALHDLKDYGDTDESIYRDLFKSGAIRIEIALDDMKKQEKSKKIYYIEDPDKLPYQYVNKYITISEDFYQGEFQKRWREQQSKEHKA